MKRATSSSSVGVLAMAFFVSPLLLALAPECQALEPRQKVRWLEHSGTCDGSAAVALGTTRFVAANDEEDTLRVYARDRSGPPQWSLDLTRFLGPSGPDDQEADLEGATTLGQRIFWIGSHSLSRKGLQRPRRGQLFATDVVGAGASLRLKPAGRPYRHLLDDMRAHPDFVRLGLTKAMSIAPEQTGGFNIEGLGSTSDGRLWVGLRGPVVGGRAIAFAITNADDVVTGKARAKLESPQLLDLGGLGIRSLEGAPGQDTLRIVAGHWTDKGRFAVYDWDTRAATPTRRPQPLPQDLNPEGLVIYPDQEDALHLMSDDGSRDRDGRPCKELVAPEQRRFRSVLLSY